MMPIKKNNKKNFLTVFIFAFIFIGLPLFADSQYGSNTSNVSIPDNDGWVYSSITISGAPADAIVTGVDAHFSCIHTYSGDLDVDINDSGFTRNYDFWQNEGGSADNPSRTVYNISTFNGLSVNGTWYLWAQDTAAGDTGYIDEWWITIYYTSTTQTYSVYAKIDSLSYGTDADGDGYYETFDFRIGIDGDVTPGSASIYAKMICNTTGQVWWSSSPWTISGTTTDYYYFAFDETDFSGYISGNTNLDFTVEIWNSTKTTKLATDTSVTGEPVKADYYVPPSYWVYGVIDSLVYGTDADGDGYYETFDFRIGVDGDVSPGSATIYAKMICNTTGQVWWSASSWTVSGTATDYYYFAFDETDFSGYISGNTDLDFTVEIWNSTKTTKLATDTSVTGEPVKADYYEAATPELVRIHGRMEYIDINGASRPIKYAKIEIRDRDLVFDDVYETYTNGSGNYDITIQNREIDGSGADLIITLFAQGSVAGNPFANHSIAVVRDPDIEVIYFFSTDETTPYYENNQSEDLNINFTFNNHPENGAFSIYDSIVEGYLLVHQYFSETMPSIDVWWESSSTFYRSGGEQSGIHLVLGDRWDRDVILHEYGHFIQHTFGFQLGSVGSSTSHTWEADLRNWPVNRTDEEAMNLAFREAWPTWFSIASQYSKTTDPVYHDLDDANDIPGNYNIENNLETDTSLNSFYSPGEYFECLNGCLLWDIYDANNHSLDNNDTLSLGHDEIWNVVNGVDKPDNIVGFWDSWFGQYGYALEMTRIFLDHNMSFIAQTPTGPSPADGSINQPLSLTLNWEDSNNATSYDVYFGTNSNPPPLVCTANSYFPVGPLIAGQTYYWKIVARDDHAEAEGPVWSFTTIIPITYTLNVTVYPSGSGSVTKNPDKSLYNQNEVVQLTAIPAAGYTFVGWNGDVISTANPISVTMNSNKNITANFIPITYTLNVSVNPAGSGSVTKNPDKSSYNFNEVVQLTANPAAGYAFSGWSGDVISTNNPVSVAMNSNKNITANFIPITYTLNVSVNPAGSGSVTKNPDKPSYNYNEVVQLTANPAAGYAFSSWSGSVSGTANPLSVTMNSSKTITANFTPLAYTLNVNVNPAGSGSVTKNPDKSSYNYNEVVQLTASPAAGYTFSSWSGSVSGTANPLSVTMNSNKTITANFTPITYTLNVSVNPAGSGSVTKNPNKSSYNYNEVVQLTANPAAGYAFSSWSGSVSGTANPLSVTMNSNKTITANFTPITYTLTLNANPADGGSVTSNPSKTSYNYNEVVQLTATPATRYTFTGWSGDASGTTNPLSVTMNSNKTITANFAIMTRTLTVNVNPAGSGSVTKNPDKSAYEYNEVVQLTATPAAGYTFSSWSGDASGTANPLSVTMNSNKTITANFTPITHTLTLSVSPPDSGSVAKNPDKPSYDHNEVVQLTATPSSGYTFAGWSGDASGTANPLSVTMNSNKNITANFAPPGNLSVVPVEGLSSSGAPGGPFTPSSKIYTVKNTGDTSIDFTVTKSAAWITLSNTGQTLAPDQSVSVTVSINDNANILGIGTYSDSVIFTNTTNGNGNTTRNAALNISEQESITVTSPNGGESWEVGSTHEITWTSTGMEVGTKVSIQYSTHNGVSWTNIVPYTPNDGNYSWRVPDTPSNNCLIRISGSTSDTGPSDVSDSVFSIPSPSTITVTSPNGGESLTVGAKHEITWTSAGTVNIGNVRIAYSTNRGGSWTTIVTSTVNDGSHHWTVPNTLSDNCLVRIIGLDKDIHPSDVSDKVFSIVSPSTITVTSPNGGESLTAGTTHEITWAKAGTDNFDNVKIEYSTNNGTSWVEITVSTANNGSYVWTVPNTPSDNCLVRVSDIDGDPADVSDAVFTITSTPSITLTSPSGGESWEAGTSHHITWTSTGSPGNLKIEYSTDNGASWIHIEFSTPNDGIFNWAVPDTPADNCLVRISTSSTDQSVSDVSDDVFSIVPPSSPSITVTSPNGGEKLRVGSIHQISWTTIGTVDNIKIEYSTNSGTSWTEVVSSMSNIGYFEWSVPDTTSGNCLVRISETDGEPSDISDSEFSIVSPSSAAITVTSPNGGEILEIGSTHEISWTSNGMDDSDNVIIGYSVDSGISWTDIVISPANNSSYNWTVPDNPSDNCLVRISRSDQDEEASDVSDAEFSIVLPSSGTITVTSPNGGETLAAGSTHEITWTSTGTVNNVMIEYSTNRGASWTAIIESIPNTGTYTWTVPDTPADECLVQISALDADKDPSDQSDALFSIISTSLDMTTPNGGEILQPGENFLITWENDAKIENVKLEYSPDNGSTYFTINDRIPDNGCYEWQVPHHISSNCLVRVSNANGWTPTQHVLQYELKFKIPGSGLLTITGGEIFTIFFGDVLNEPIKDFLCKISIIREAYGDNYVRFNDTIKKLPQTQPVFNRWNRLRVLLNQETLSTSLWLNGQMVFENLPLKPGSIFFPAASFSIEAKSTGYSTSVEIDDFTVRILDSWGIVNETRFITLFTEDFENFEAGAFPVKADSGWEKIGFLNRNKKQTDPSEETENSVLISRDFISGMKCLKINTIEESQVTVIKYFNIPGYFPFDTSDKPFEIKYKENILK